MSLRRLWRGVGAGPARQAVVSGRSVGVALVPRVTAVLRRDLCATVAPHVSIPSTCGARHSGAQTPPFLDVVPSRHSETHTPLRPWAGSARRAGARTPPRSGVRRWEAELVADCVRLSRRPSNDIPSCPAAASVCEAGLGVVPPRRALRPEVSRCFSNDIPSCPAAATVCEAGLGVVPPRRAPRIPTGWRDAARHGGTTPSRTLNARTTTTTAP